MQLKSLFLSHYHGDAKEVNELATELRLRGAVPWVDKDGGFNLGDNDKVEVRRVIREDSFGLLLYATEHVFQRSFIKKVEINEAKRMKKEDPNFLLVAIPVLIDFNRLQKLSQKHFGIDLSDFYSVAIPGQGEAKLILEKISRLVLIRILQRASANIWTGRHLSLQISTREVLPDERDDVLRIDATKLFNLDTRHLTEWDRLLKGLVDVKQAIANHYGRPRLRIHGSKHLTAAFMVGRVFSPFQIDIRQGQDYWATDEAYQNASVRVELLDYDSESDIISVEVSATGKNVTPAIDRIISKGFSPRGRLQCTLDESISWINGGMCKDIVRRVRHQIEKAVGSWNIRTIHLFAAVPQTLMVMLGRELGALPSVQLYEYEGGSYTPSLIVPSGAL